MKSQKLSIPLLCIAMLVTIIAILYKNLDSNTATSQNTSMISLKPQELKDPKALQNLSKELVVQINDALRRFKANDPTLQLGFYFRDLEFDQVASIDANQNFMPASLLKLPLMMSIYKDAEVDPSLLARSFEYKVGLDTLKDASQRVLPAHQLVEGEVIHIENLIEQMITDSSNQATSVLLHHFGGTETVRTALQEMDIIVVREGEKRFLTPHTYAQLFVRLYRSTFLSPAMSTKAIDVLSRSNFKQGLKARLPQEIKVANKFGERELEDVNQLHDCGIVFLPKNPYVICVMTKGQDFKVLEAFIAEVSKIAFDRMSRFVQDLK